MRRLLGIGLILLANLLVPLGLAQTNYCSTAGGTRSANLFALDGTFGTAPSGTQTPTLTSSTNKTPTVQPTRYSLNTIPGITSGLDSSGRPIGSTTYTLNTRTAVNYAGNYSPEDGEYEVTNSTYNRQDGAWHRFVGGRNGGGNQDLFMVINAAYAAGIFYQQTLTVNPNTNYEFSISVINIIANNASILPNINLEIDRAGVDDNNNGTIDEAGEAQVVTLTGDIANTSTPTWKEYGGVINSGASTSITVRFRNNAPGGGGNDLAIDNLQFTSCTGLPTGNISGNLYYDSNNNGSLDTGETGLGANIPVELVNPVTSVIVATAQTNSSGAYSFTGVPAGTYNIRVNASSSQLNGATPRTPSTSQLSSVVLASGASLTNQNFGYLIPQLSVSKSASVTSTSPGSSYTYTITVSNTGQASATNAKLQDILPNGLTYVANSATINGVNQSAAAYPFATAFSINSTTGAAGVIKAGETATIAFQVTVNNSTPLPTSPITNIGTVTYSGGPGGSINSNTVSTTVSFPDLSITKSHTGNFTRGTTGTYTIRVNNVGSATSSGTITVTDTLPTGLTYASNTASWTCSGTTTVTCTSPVGLTVASGGNTSFNLVVNVGETAASSVTNNVSVSGGGQTNTSNDTASDGTTVVSSADLSITKTDSSTTAVVGGPISYTITVSNAGPSTSTGATVTDTLPGAITGATWTCVASSGSSCTASGSGNVNTTVTLLSGGTATFTVSGTISTSASGTLANTASVSAPGSAPDPNSANNSATDTDTIIPQAELAITKTNSVSSVNVGGSTAYIIRVTNNGPNSVTGAILSDPAVAGLSKTVVACSTTPGQCVTPPTVAQLEAGTFALPALAVSQFYEIRVSANVTATSGSVTNTATIAVPSGYADLTSSNNTASDTDTVNVANLAITKSHSGNFDFNSTGTYSILVSNAATAGATSGTVTVTDTLRTSSSNATAPTGISITAMSGTGWTCTPASGTCTRSDALAPGASYPAITVTVTLGTNAAATFTNRGVVSGGGEGATTTDNTADDNTTVSFPDLSIVKDHAGNFPKGGTGTFNITVSNASGAPATSGTVTVTDTLPSGLSYSGTTPFTVNGWSCTYTSGTRLFTCTRSDSLAGGSSYPPLTLTVAVGSSAASSTNTATVSGGGDQTTANNSSSDAYTTFTVVNNVDLSITKTLSSGVPVPGTSVTYTLTVTNSASSAYATALTAISVVDLLPTALSGVTYTPSSGTYNSSTGDWTGISLARGASITLTVSGTIARSALGSLVNTATVAPSGTSISDSNNANNTATDTRVLIPTVNLNISKTDNLTTVVPGNPITYSIILTNSGSSDLQSATLADVIDTSKLQSITWTCTAAGGATCTPSGSGNISDTIDLPSTSTNAAARLTYTVSATVISSATGTLSNTASVTLPSGATNTSGSLSATDTTTIQPTVNLTVSKTDGVSSVVPGNAVSYTITISNANTVVVGGNTFNTNNLTGATVSDVLDTNLYQGISWTCSASSGSSCSASGSGSISDTVTILRGGSLTYTVNATVKPSATGSLINTVNVTMPSGVTNAGGSSATDTDTLNPTVNLSISKTDGKTTILPGATEQYTIVVSNSGPSNLVGATLTDTLPSGLNGVTWTCATSGGATCTASGSGNISQTVSIPAGGSLTYTVNATVSISASGTLSNTVNLNMPVGTTNTGSSSAADSTDILTLTATKSVSSSTPVLPGTTLTYTITITNTSAVAITGATFTDALPTGTTYYPGSATLNGSAIAGSYPFASAYSINSPSAASGTLAAGASATIIYKLIVNSTTPPSSVSNQGAVNFTGDPSGGILTDDPSTAPAADSTVSSVTTPSTFFLNYEDGSDGSYNCVVTSDMGVGGLDATGAVFGRSQVNLPINGLLHLVSGQLDNAAQNSSLESPWMRFGVSGYSNVVSFRHKINNISTTNARIVVSVIEAGTGIETTLYTYTYVAGDVGVTKSASLAVSQTGVYKVRIRFLGTSGSGTSRIALDDWIVAAPQATVATGTLAAPVSGASCNYIVDPTIVKSGPATTTQFNVVTYTLTITNNGPAAFQGSITDTVPANFTSVSWSCVAAGDADCDSGASGTGSSGSGNAISLANVRIRPGSGNSVVITVTATATIAGSIINTALVVLPSGATDNVNPADNTSSITTLINVAGVTVSGFIYADQQPNFLRDPTESWASGATVRVNLVQGGSVVKTTTVNAGTGTYSFSTVLAGSYTIVITNTGTATTAVAPIGWLFITPGTGSLSITVGTSDLIEQNFGLFNGSKVSGTVFRDDGYSSGTANDALQNGGELGISNVAVTASDGTNTLSTLTNTGGSFSFYVPASFGSTLTLAHTQNPATGTNVGGASVVLATAFNNAAARSRSISSFMAGQTYSVYNFGVVYASSFRLDQSGQTTSPGAITYSHRFRPGTLGDVSLSLNTGSFGYLVRRDVNCNNIYDSSETYQPVPLSFTVDSTWPRDPDGRLSECTVEILVSVPDGKPSGMVDIAQLQAELQWSRPVVSPVIRDTRTVIDTTTLLLPGNLRLDKQVRNVTQGTSFSVGTQGKPGEVLEYCIGYSNIGAQPISGVIMTDPIPFFTQYQSSSLLWNSSSLTDSTDSDAGELVSNAFIEVRIGNLSAGQSGQVCYRVTVR